MTEKETKPTKRKRGLFQFSLRSLLFLMLACSLALGWMSMHLQSYRRQAKALNKVSIKSVYIGSQPGKPAWLVRFTDKEKYRDITHLSFHNVPRFRDADIVHLKRFPRLELLSLHRTSISDEGLAEIKNLRELHTLSIKYTQLTDDCLVHLSQMQKMKKLQLSGTQITGAGLANLPDMPKLEILELNDLNITDDDIVHLTRFPKLRHLQLIRIKVSGPALAQLSRLPELETLHVESKDIKQLDLKGFPKLEELSVVSSGYEKVRIENMPALQRLNLAEHPPTKTDVALQSMELKLIDLPQITHYICPDTVTRMTLDNLEDLSYLNLPPRIIRTVIRHPLPSLKTLIFHVKNSNDQDRDKIFSIIEQAPNVEEIELACDRVDGQTLRRIHSLFDFDTLVLNGKSIKAEALADLKNCTQVKAMGLSGSAYWSGVNYKNYPFGSRETVESRKSLTLHSSDVDASTIRELAAMRNLRKLLIGNTKADDETLAQLATLKQLQTLHLWGLQISDEGMESVRGISSLEMLYLGLSEISDNGLKHFADHPHLQSIFLYSTKTSFDATSQAKRYLPFEINLQSQQWKDFINEKPSKEE